MSNANIIFRILAKLQADDSSTRDQGASEAADWLESEKLLENQYRTLVQELLEKSTTESDLAAKESMLNALSSASMSSMSQVINWDPIVGIIDGLELNCLEHALVILGFSKQAKYRKIIEGFLKHPDREIRQVAAEALEENQGSWARRSV